MNDLPHVRIFSRTSTLIKIFRHELREKHDVETALFLVYGVKHLQTALQRSGV